MCDAYAGLLPVNVTRFVCAKSACVRYGARWLFSRPSEPENTNEKIKCRDFVSNQDGVLARCSTLPTERRWMRLGDSDKTSQNE